MAKNKKRKLHDAPPKPGQTSQPSKAAKAAKSAPPKRLEPTIPFQPTDRMLLIGEGDFSFAHSLVSTHGCCDVTATCYDTQTQLFEKYTPQGEEHVRFLEAEGQAVLYGVDATKLDQTKSLKKSGGQWDVVVFNFPHVGGKSKDVNRQVRFNQELLVKFFTTVKVVLAHEGTVVVTLFEGEPYTLWCIKDVARHAGLEVKRSFKFMAEAYPGYSHARTLGNIEGGGGWKGEDREARSFVFGVKVEPANKMGVHPDRDWSRQPKKRSRDEGSSDEED